MTIANYEFTGEGMQRVFENEMDCGNQELEAGQ